MIVPTLARLIVREHLFRPLTDKVLTLGRQTVAMRLDQLVELLREEGISVSDSLIRECSERDEETRVGKGTDFVTDRVFFKMLGINDVQVMDVSDYEGAQVVHNLNNPIPEEFVNGFDFIIDGGTFDHLFDLRVAFANVVKLLRPGGRVFQWNAASNYVGNAYVSFGPDLFYDYYVLNGFVDCKVYLAEVDDMGQLESWDFYSYESAEFPRHRPSPRLQMVVVLAEKGSAPTCNLLPTQGHYRNRAEQEDFQRKRLRIAQSRRPVLSMTEMDRIRAKKNSKPHESKWISKIKAKGIKGTVKSLAALPSRFVRGLVRRLRGETARITSDVPGYTYRCTI